MINIRESILRCNLKPRVESDLPGRMRILFPRYALLPNSARPYIHYVEDVLKLLPGVHTVRVNARIGTVLVLYDQTMCTARQILRWVDMMNQTIQRKKPERFRWRRKSKTRSFTGRSLFCCKRQEKQIDS